ncbi:hypothetical protein B0H12DRAFT_1236824 [Mycena haematopus]|nr:hypothetical protein B0H12DRAFT_1236824 [Mycena haematopus]
MYAADFSSAPWIRQTRRFAANRSPHRELGDDSASRFAQAATGSNNRHTTTSRSALIVRHGGNSRHSPLHIVSHPAAPSFIPTTRCSASNLTSVHVHRPYLSGFLLRFVRSKHPRSTPGLGLAGDRCVSPNLIARKTGMLPMLPCPRSRPSTHDTLSRLNFILLREGLASTRAMDEAGSLHSILELTTPCHPSPRLVIPPRLSSFQSSPPLCHASSSSVAGGLQDSDRRGCDSAAERRTSSGQNGAGFVRPWSGQPTVQLECVSEDKVEWYWLSVEQSTLPTRHETTSPAPVHVQSLTTPSVSSPLPRLPWSPPHLTIFPSFLALRLRATHPHPQYTRTRTAENEVRMRAEDMDSGANGERGAIGVFGPRGTACVRVECGRRESRSTLPTRVVSSSPVLPSPAYLTLFPSFLVLRICGAHPRPQYTRTRSAENARGSYARAGGLAEDVA